MVIFYLHPFVKRLREDIISTIVNRLASEDEYMTSGGIVSELLGSPYFNLSGGFMRGKINAPIQLLLSIGLKNAGEKELACRIATRYCDLVCKTGLSSWMCETIVEWTSETAAIFLTIASYLLGED